MNFLCFLEMCVKMKLFEENEVMSAPVGESPLRLFLRNRFTLGVR